MHAECKSLCCSNSFAFAQSKTSGCVALLVVVGRLLRILGFQNCDSHCDVELFKSMVLMISCCLCIIHISGLNLNCTYAVPPRCAYFERSAHSAGPSEYDRLTGSTVMLIKLRLVY